MAPLRLFDEVPAFGSGEGDVEREQDVSQDVGNIVLLEHVNLEARSLPGGEWMGLETRHGSWGAGGRGGGRSWGLDGVDGEERMAGLGEGGTTRQVRRFTAWLGCVV